MGSYIWGLVRDLRDPQEPRRPLGGTFVSFKCLHAAPLCVSVFVCVNVFVCVSVVLSVCEGVDVEPCGLLAVAL